MKFFLVFISFQAYTQKLSDQTTVSLLTIAPGSELYSTFGHSAIRIRDPKLMIDVNYNYGTFNFNEPGFYLKFLRGYLNYLISSHPATDEIGYWNWENRLITEQILNLDQNQKQGIFDFLENNLKPENRVYRYLFFTDNCSTRLRDVIQETCGENLNFNHNLNADSTFRQWVNRYALDNKKEWAAFGMDLALGLGSDEKTGWSDAMFLPDKLMEALDQAKINTEQGVQNFVLAKHHLNNPYDEVHNNIVFTPKTAFGLLFLFTLIFTAYQIYKGDKSIFYDKILFSIVGISGWILFLLWFFTDHGVTRNNPGLLWASPLVFPAVFYLKQKSWAVWLFYIYSVLFILGYLGLFLFTGNSVKLEILLISLSIWLRLYFLFKNVGFRERKKGFN